MNVKRFFAVLICAAMVLAVFPAAEAAEYSGSCGDAVNWFFDASTGVLTISGDGDMEDYASGGSPWYAYCASIVSVVIEDGVTRIGKYAFGNCRAMMSVTIADSVASMGQSAFAGCSALQNLYIDSLEAWCGIDIYGKYDSTPMYYAQNLYVNGVLTEDIVIPDSAAEVKKMAFYAADFVKSVTIPEGVTSIGERAFAYCYNLKSVNIPDSVTSIGSSAFYDAALESVTIGYKTTSIGTEAFSSGVMIYGYSGSAAEDFAAENGNEFVSLGEVPVDEVTVTSYSELVAALASNRIITLEDGIYTTSSPLTISGLRNLTIIAANSGKAEILSTDGYNPVVKILNSANVELNGLILGHESLEYRGSSCGDSLYSSGYVVYAASCENVGVIDCDLYGCGTIGVYLSSTLGFEAEGCVIRDCKERIALLGYSEAVFTNCVISGNAYDEDYAIYDAVGTFNVSGTGDALFDGCTFLNNYSLSFTTSDYVRTENCVFENNVWDGKTPLSYGVCLNGITWQIENRTLKLGYDLTLEEGTVIESALGEVLPYSESSLPWKGLTYTKVDLADGVTYEGVGSEGNAGDVTASGECGDSVNWYIDGGTLVIYGSGDMEGGNSSPWRTYNSIITEVVIEDGVTSIGRYAFYGLWKLTSVTIPESVTSIGMSAFGWCSNLGKITIPASVKSIGDQAFVYCSALESVAMDEGVESIGATAFGHCGALTAVTIPGSVISIGDSAFYECCSLESLIIEDGVESIARWAFGYCDALENVTIPDSVTDIGDYAFYHCTSLTELYLGSGVKTMGNYAFSWCTALTELYLESGLKTIGNSAFYACSALTAAEIPASVVSIGSRAFGYCGALCEITAAEENESYSSLDGVLFDKNRTELVQYPQAKSETAYDIPSTVQRIDDWAFYYALNLESVAIPESAEYIGARAFSNCGALTEITIPKNVAEIGEGAFAWCSSLSEITAASSNAYYCASDGILFSKDKTTLVAYPAGKNDVSFDVPSSVTEIGAYAFAGCYNIKAIEMPEGLETIGSYAFYSCRSVENFDVPSSVTEIGSYAFGYCTSLTSIEIPEGVSEIGEGTFYECYSLESVILPSTVTAIGEEAFSYCESLTSIEIPSGVTEILDYTFEDCMALTQVTIPNSVTMIAWGAFSGCESLSDVYYTGTLEEWEAIDNESEEVMAASIYCEDGSITQIEPIDVLLPGVGEYEGVVEAEVYVNEDGEVVIYLMSGSDEISLESMNAYVAEYSGGALARMTELEREDWSDEAMFTGELTSGDYGIFIWDENMKPVTEAVR